MVNDRLAAGGPRVVRLAVANLANNLAADAAFTAAYQATIPGYRTGQFYGPIGASTSTRSFSANQLRVVPFRVRSSQLFDRISIETTTAGGAGTLYRLGVFASHTDGFPGAVLLDAGTVAGDAAPAPQTITISLTLTPGVYWLGVAAQSVAGSPVLRGLSGGDTSGVNLAQPQSGVHTGVTTSFLFTAAGAFTSLATVVPGDRSALGPVILLRAG